MLTAQAQAVDRLLIYLCAGGEPEIWLLLVTRFDQDLRRTITQALGPRQADPNTVDTLLHEFWHHLFTKRRQLLRIPQGRKTSLWSRLRGLAILEVPWYRGRRARRRRQVSFTDHPPPESLGHEEVDADWLEGLRARLGPRLREYLQTTLLGQASDRPIPPFTDDGAAKARQRIKAILRAMFAEDREGK
jgi:hypothetical protein